MNKSINTIHNELNTILDELQTLSKVIGDREKIQDVKKLYFTQNGSETYELIINDSAFALTISDVRVLLEQMQDSNALDKIVNTLSAH
jgi:hypothetical protein